MTDVQALSDIINDQDNLLQDAAAALPYEFSQCTYNSGHIRQAVYLCQTCPEQRGICAACSVACHTDHEQLELFPKRNFRCDCPTTSMAHSCSLHHDNEPGNSENHYNQNFTAKFCRCSREYDAKTEQETMIQCLACEDWFHESCLNLRKPLGSDAVAEECPTPTLNDDSRSEASSSGLPAPLISADDYDSLVCMSCVLSMPILRLWAGTAGVLMVNRQSLDDTWRIIGSFEPTLPGSKSEEVELAVEVFDGIGSSAAAGSKRRRSTSRDSARAEKRQRAESSSDGISSAEQCIAPPPNPVAQKLLESAQAGDTSMAAGDIFLTEGWRERWCRCSTCSSQLSNWPFLLNEEETYEPPEDPDSGRSLEELGMRALERLPRDRAIEGIHAFNSMRDGLIKFLKPFAEEKKDVGKSDIEGFFQTLREGGKSSQ